MNKIITLALGMALAMPMLAQIPQTLSFQGYLTSDAGEPITTETGSPLSVSFSLYNAASGGSLVWGPEPQTIEVDRGIFNTVLGSIEPLNIDANAPYFLQITIGAEDLPRIAVTSGLYSLSTSNAENITSNQLAIANGGTNAVNAADARTNLDAQQADAGLSSIAGLTTVADQMLYLDGSDSYATTSLTAFGRELLDDVDAAAAQATIGLAVGTDVQGFDAGLQSISGLTTSDNQMLYLNGSDSYTTTTLTAFARSLLAEGDAADARMTLSAQAFDAGLQSISGLTTSSDQMIYSTDSDVYGTTSLTPFARTLLGDGDAAAARSTLGTQNASNITTGTIADARLESTVDVTALNVASSQVSISSTGYTQLGSSGVSATNGTVSYPSFKVMMIEGTTGLVNGTATVGISGITDAQIISIEILVEESTGSFIPPGFTAIAGFQFTFNYNGGDLFIRNVSSNSANIGSKPFKAIIRYIE